MEESRVLGQQHIVRHFENAIQMGKISHAYILNGETGSGKMRLAMNFAKALQCEQNDPFKERIPGVACNECKSCKQTESKNQPDIKYITYEKSGIGVDEIRTQINNDIDIKPYSSRYKVYIVPESEKMTVAAQNALLKTIEEPPEYAVIILLTTNADSFLPTILSRCVLLNMKPVKEELIKNQLMAGYGIGEYDAKVAAIFSAGNPGKAVKLATSEDFQDLKKCIVGTLFSLKTGGMDVVSNKVKEATEFKKVINEYMALMRSWFRDVLMYKATKNEEAIIFQEEVRSVEEMAEDCSFFDLDIILKSIDQAENRVRSNVNFELTIEVLLLAIKERIQK
ncbi:MAG: DNA polymerase III subunit [Eubacterium sp.]|nr:DNA polymerase III subunit [Eubacterium sp.]